MQEADVVRVTRSFLLQHGLAGYRVVDLYTDAHPTLLGDRTLRPFQRFTLSLEGLTVHPDLVGRLDDGETTFAVEAKGSDDYLRGLAQAASYRMAFHLVLLAGAAPVSPALVSLAREQHIGCLAVEPGGVKLLELPAVHLPFRKYAASVQQQFITTQAAETAFVFNLPTHYLSVPLAMRTLRHASLATLEPLLRAQYPQLPRGTKSFRSAVRGAQKLGLVRVRGEELELTIAGEAAGHLLPDLRTLAEIHGALVRDRGATLHEQDPRASAVLRWLLSTEPITVLIVETLSGLGDRLVPMWDLVRRATERDKARALAAFFNPERVSEIMDQTGTVMWRRVTPRHFRSTLFFQYKSMLKHAGLLVAHPLGGSSVSAYNPREDWWELARTD